MRTLLLVLLPFTVWAQNNRPTPYPVFASVPFEQAVINQTRTPTGLPGPAYWTNKAEYNISATLNPTSHELEGQIYIRYFNQSPHPLPFLVLNLYQNIYKPGAVRNRYVEPTSGIELRHVAVGDTPLDVQPELEQAGYVVNGTKLVINPGTPVATGDSISLNLAWRYTVPANSFRNGHDDDVHFIAYWYPQMAVFDDIHGWDADPYFGNGEFYMGYADYDVALTVPEGWLIGATGTLTNPEQVLSEQTRRRLASAHTQRTPTWIVTEDDRQPGRSTTTHPDGWLTWHFSAQQVRDFAFGTSASYLWHAARIDVDRNLDGQPDPTLAQAFFRPDKKAWSEAASFVQFSIEYLSDQLGPYPWPHMTAVEGIIGGGMEYPMLTLIGGNRPNPRSLFGVTFHETAHMWFPMIVGQDEKTFTWMDEGLTSFNTNNGKAVFFNDPSAWAPEQQGYYRIAGSGYEVESMRHGDQYPFGSPARGLASYNKPAVALHALRGIVGPNRFQMALREYARRWAYKHPQPEDLFNTFEDVLGEDLDWFWTPLFYETWTLDQAIASVESVQEHLQVHIQDLGLTPMPATVQVTYQDGSIQQRTIPVQTWLDGATDTTLTFPPGSVQSVTIDPDLFLPDVDRSNNVWNAP